MAAQEPSAQGSARRATLAPAGQPGRAPLPLPTAPAQPSAAAPRPVPVPQPLPAARPVPVAPGATNTNGAPTALELRTAAAAPNPAATTAARPIPLPQGSVLPQQRPPAQAEEEEEAPPLDEVVKRNAPPWLISAAVQTVIVLILGLWIMPRRADETVVLDSGYYAEQLGEQFADDPLDFESLEPESDSMAFSDLPPVENPLAGAVTLPNVLEGLTGVSDLPAPAAGIALEGRDEGMKEALLRGYGGNKLSEAAVKRALDWLARQQKPDGSWSLKGPYSDGARIENTAAATAMALLAFQGAGHTHKKGLAAFQKVVEKGMKYLLKLQDQEGNFFQEQRRDQWMYTQAQCTIAICELYAMTRDPALKEPAEKAVAFCIAAQGRAGGWRYRPADDSDTSVTGWMVMALQSGKLAGIAVPKPVFEKVNRFLDQAGGESDIRYSYQPGTEPTEVMTAEALLCRQWLGWARNDPRMEKAADWLLEEENLPSWQTPNAYYWYYATQMFHHLEGDRWKKWNGVMRDMLVDAQVTSGREAGSWHPTRPQPDRWGNQAGRLYMTCLCTYVLEVYYRHLPLYSGGVR